MLKPASRFLFTFGFLSLAIFSSPCAKAATWTDLQGNSFKGKPDSLFGPFALFETGGNKGRRVLLHMLSPEDCARFAREIADAPQRADKWAKSKSYLGTEMVGRLSRLEGDKLVPVDFGNLREPELYVLIFTSAWEGDSYRFPNLLRSNYERLKRLYGDRVEFVNFGIRHDPEGNANLARATRTPWLVAAYGQQSSMEAFRSYAPAEGFAMVLITRTGIPLAISRAESFLAVKRFADDVCGLMATADDQNPHSWKDRAYYQRYARPQQHAADFAAPLLIGNPLRDASLRKNKIKNLRASMEIDAEGKVLSVALKDAAELSPALAQQLEKALLTVTLFVPAIKEGKPVAATYDFVHSVPEASAASEDDRTWVYLAMRKETPVPTWLLMRPIPVPQGEFSTVQHVDSNGVAQMSALTVGKESVTRKEQLNAFKSDFFGTDGPGSVTPVEGQVQEVDGQSYTWQRYESQDGLVDFHNGKSCDYSVGYAWAEFDSPSAGAALMGIGSDDGIKIWLNGTLIHDRWVQRPSKIDEDLVPMQLLAGKNRVLIKIQNMKDDWSFFLRIRR